MFVSEIFLSIQGEGELAGVPSVFVRTSGCNLRCNWCDTPYASWNPEGEELSVDEVVRRVVRYTVRHVVITGGEPMIAKEMQELARLLHDQGHHLTIETAATVRPEGIACDLASLSPKLLNSTPDDRASTGWKEKHASLRFQPDVIRDWIDHYPYQLKFVISSPGDLTEIEAMMRDLNRDIPREKILLMPQGTDHQTLATTSRWLVEECTKRGYRYTPRLHIELFGNVRGR